MSLKAVATWDKPPQPQPRVPVQDLLDSFDWHKTALGPLASWPIALQSSLQLCLGLQMPCALYMGKDRTAVWNEAYVPIAGEKHPAKFGGPVRDVYPEVPFLDEKVEEMFVTGEPFGATGYRALLNNTTQEAFQNEGFYDWTLSPVRDSDGTICAIFNVCQEVTNQVLLDRRTTALSALASKAARGQSVAGVCHAMVAALENAPDVPWMAVYAKNDDHNNQAMDFADALAGQGQARSLGRHGRSRHPYRLVATSFDKDLVRHSYSSGGRSHPDLDDDDDEGELSHSKSSKDGEDRFEPGTSSRALPDWLPSLPDKVNLKPIFKVERRESASSVATESSSLAPTPSLASTRSNHSDDWAMGSASPSTSTSASTASETSHWPFETLSTESPHVLVTIPTDTSQYSESILIAVTSVSPSTGHSQVLGVIVAGLNENRKFDESYLTFFQGIASQFETAFLNGKAREDDRRTAEALRRLNRDRVQFFQNTAHELRTPLTLMLGPLEELVEAHTATECGTLTTAAPPEQTLAKLSLISRNARRLLKLVNSILRFSSIESGKLDTRFERQATFGMFTRQLAECFEPMASQSGIALVLDKGLALNKAKDETAFDRQTTDGLKEDVFIDIDLWEQVVFNTLSNAFKNTWKGSITVSLYESSQDGQEGFRLDIADTGVGISKEQLPSIFERFYRADNSDARSAEGTGIGLSLVRELVRLHGGNISATSELGKGTTFTVWIPRGLNHLPHDRVFATSDPGVDEADRPGTARAAGDRWNAKARGVERASILEQMDTLMKDSRSVGTSDTRFALSLESRARPTDDANSSRTSQVSRSGAGSPTPLAAPAGLVPGSYFPEMDAIAQADETAADSPPPEPKKRRIAAKQVGSRFHGETSSSHAHWSSTGTAERADDSSRPLLGRTQSGLPALDPSERATILVVDDNQDMRFWIQSILQVDYNVVEARNGREALETMQTLTPDLVLSDVNMPLMNGLSLVKALRGDQRVSQIPVILLSARSGQEDAIEGLDAGAADYLTKPFNVRDLLARCRVHVRLNRLRLQTREVENDLLIQQSKIEAKNSLLGLVSHELRTPLQTIQGAADLLKQTPKVPTDLIEAISHGAETLGSRIDQLIDVAQVGSNRFQLAMETFDLDEALTATLAKHAPLASRNGVNIFSIVGRAPSHISTDRERMLQVLDVLVANAVKFTLAGEIVVRVWIENAAGEELEVYTDNDAFLCFAVCDSGSGIPQELAATIFQPFSLADSSSTRRHGGAGLGLTLALRLVELAGGQLGVESTLGKGSEFRCRWPISMQLNSPSQDFVGDVVPIVVVVSSNEPFAQSILCTAETFGWQTGEIAMDLAAADAMLSAHKGHQPIIFFVCELALKLEPAATKAFVDRLSFVRTPALPGSGLPGTRSYAVIAAKGLSPRDSYDAYQFHGGISPPYYRTHVRAVVNDILAQRRRPSLFDHHRGSDGASTTVSAATAEESTSGAFPHGRLLIAEDNKVNAKLLVRQLKTLGFAADEAEHGLRVLDLIHEETEGNKSPTPTDPYVGILMDLDMPQMDGFEATRRVRGLGGRFRDLPVLAVSANGSMDIRERVAAAGMDDFLSKPVSIAQLTALLQRNGLIKP